MTLNSAIRTWVQEQIGNIIQEEKLQGSTSTTLYRISSVDKQYVLRLFDNQEWLATEPDLCEHEASALKTATSATVRTPECIAFEADATVAGMPLLLMELLPGEVCLKPDNMDDYLRQAAEALASIHRVEAPDFAWKHYRYKPIHDLKVPTWSAFPDKWQAIIDILQSPEPEAKTVFIHRDYHMTNFLWQDGKLSGVVDWINACTGYAGTDVGHMRFNLAQLYSTEISDKFLQAYQIANPDFEYMPYWDIVAIGDTILYDDKPPGIYQPWVDFGVEGLTQALMQKRAEAYAGHILSHF